MHFYFLQGHIISVDGGTLKFLEVYDKIEKMVSHLEYWNASGIYNLENLNKF